MVHSAQLHSWIRFVVDVAPISIRLELWYRLPVLPSLVRTKFRHAFNLVHNSLGSRASKLTLDRTLGKN